MYSKAITEEIVHDWAKGLTAEESKEHLRNKFGITAHLNTIYNHRHGLTAQHLIDELMQQQQRAILKSDSDNPDLAMKYRNELLKILLPQRIEAYSVTKEVIENRDITIVADYTRAIESATNQNLQSLRTKQQMDTTGPQTTPT